MILPLLLLASACALAQPLAPPAKTVPFEMLWRASDGVVADASFLLPKPAGKAGFLTSKDGRLVTADGKRLRLWGVNFSFQASFPPKELAPEVAAHLARFGVNCVRIHHHDWRSPRGLIDSSYPDSRHLDPAQLDKLDFLVAELKKQGIYTDLNLNVARTFQEADGVREADRLGYAKAATIFDRKLIELQKEFARAYLTHKNLYTGNEYRHEPAIAIVEILNENSLIESWVRGRLLGKGADPKQQDKTWVDIPASYEGDLTRQYQDYLTRKLSSVELEKLRAEAGVRAGAPVPRLKPDQFKAASEFRFRTETWFYIETESRFYEEMNAFLKKDLGVRSLVVGTSAHAGGLSPYPLLVSTSKLDMLDAHTYWQHPSYSYTDGRRSYTIRNTPMVDEPARSTVMTLGRAAVAGKPFIVSEVNHPYPNEYAAEMVPILAAYGAFQDWDGIFWYSFEHSGADNWRPRPPGHFDIRQDPVKMSQLVTGAMIFLRGDVVPARRTVLRGYTPGSIADSLRLPASDGPFFTPGFPPLLPLIHGARVQSFERPAAAYPAAPTGALRSDTGQLAWAPGLVSIETPATQALVGRLGKTASTAHLEAALDQGFAAIVVSALDGKPLKQSARLLLTAGARTGNQGMAWNAERTSTPETGSAPIWIEPVTGRLTLKGVSATGLEILPLNGAGQPAGPALKAQKTSAGWVVLLDQSTPWYLLRASAP